jgi:hypothetical protein
MRRCGLGGEVQARYRLRLGYDTTQGKHCGKNDSFRSHSVPIANAAVRQQPVHLAYQQHSACGNHNNSAIFVKLVVLARQDISFETWHLLVQQHFLIGK